VTIEDTTFVEDTTLAKEDATIEKTKGIIYWGTQVYLNRPRIIFKTLISQENYFIFLIVINWLLILK